MKRKHKDNRIGEYDVYRPELTLAGNPVMNPPAKSLTIGNGCYVVLNNFEQVDIDELAKLRTIAAVKPVKKDRKEDKNE
jgi:hypothetical protein